MLQRGISCCKGGVHVEKKGRSCCKGGAHVAKKGRSCCKGGVMFQWGGVNVAKGRSSCNRGGGHVTKKFHAMYKGIVHFTKDVNVAKMELRLQNRKFILQRMLTLQKWSSDYKIKSSFYQGC